MNQVASQIVSGPSPHLSSPLLSSPLTKLWLKPYLKLEWCIFLQVRSIWNQAGEVEEAGPSIAVQMVGLNAVPVAGDEFFVCATEQEVSFFC